MNAAFMLAFDNPKLLRVFHAIYSHNGKMGIDIYELPKRTDLQESETTLLALQLVAANLVSVYAQQVGTGGTTSIYFKPACGYTVHAVSAEAVKLLDQAVKEQQKDAGSVELLKTVR